MRSFILFLCFLVPAIAFPTAANVAALARAGGIEIEETLTYDEIVRRAEQHKSKRLVVNSLEEPIAVDGKHEWREPDFAAGAQRGPCPGLNALANHGYIDRSGVAKLLDVVVAMNEVYGMGVDLSTILSVMGTVWTGNPLSLSPGFSLDGYSPKVSNLLGNLLGLLGTPRGIARSHNWLEADASLTRDDLYVTDDASTMNMDRFLKLYNRPGADSDIITTDDALEHSIDAIHDSIATNPYFWYGPYTGMIARNAGIAFAVRLLSNHSAENPRGILTKDVFKSFWGVIESDGQLTYKRGWERIPANWYKTPVDYTLLELNLDLVDWISRYPVLASIGGNTGTVNSFTLLNITDISDGLLNTQTLLEGNNLLCFTLQVVKTVSPDSLSGLFATLAKPLEILTDALGTALTDLSCKPFEDLTYGGKPIWDALTHSEFAGVEKAGAGL